ncbi:MAG TPA: YraN family protein [Burkholderiales bacterium]|nr:YraN family protein [Burkholderiales bacterium]
MNPTGARAEDLCAELLRRAGLRIVARNWRCRHGGIDLVAEDNGTLVFAEVCLRRNARFGGAAESVGAHKRAPGRCSPTVSRQLAAGAVPLRRAAARCARAAAHRVDPRRFRRVSASRRRRRAV